MIPYRPTDGDAQTTPASIRPRTCFLMTKLGEAIPDSCQTIRTDVERILNDHAIECIDANSATTGRDFLLKIWDLIVSVPLGIAIVYDGIPPKTLANIFYELGWMHALGKETLLIKTVGVEIPSDFVRTEYVAYDERFESHLRGYLQYVQAQAEYYAIVAEPVENNPLLAIDYYRRAYLISGNPKLKEWAGRVLAKAGLGKRAKNSVELLLAGFAHASAFHSGRVVVETAASLDN